MASTSIKFKRIEVSEPPQYSTKTKLYIYKCKRCKSVMTYDLTDQHAKDHNGTSITIDIS